MPFCVSNDWGNKTTALMLVLVLIGTALLFAGGITPSFSSDDYIHLEKNIGFKTLREAVDVFLHLDGREYRPLVRLSLWLNLRMGTTAVPFHITNLLLHLGCIACLFFLFRQFLESNACALVASLLFAFHPIHTTNVNFIMGRTGMLCALFYFLSLLLYLVSVKKSKIVLYTISLVCFIFALLSKEEAVSLPILLFCIMLLHPVQHIRKPMMGAVMHLAPFFILLLAYLTFRFVYLSEYIDNIDVYTNFNIFHILINYVKWAVGILYPFDLYEARWAMETGQFFPIAVPIGFVCLFAAVLAYLLWRNKNALLRDKLMLLSVLWFIVTLMPIMGGNAHRWYLYIPSVGLSFFIMALWQQKPSGFQKLIFFGLLIAATACYSLEVYKQSAIWSRQSKITQTFFKQAEVLGIHNLDNFHFINMPFGYKSAFLFTFESFTNALGVKYGKKPQIKILSHLNLGDDTRVTVNQSADTLTFHLEPSALGYCIFPDLRRIFLARDTTIKIDPYQIRVKRLSSAHTVRTFEINATSNPAVPVFYYDGRDIHEISFINQ